MRNKKRLHRKKRIRAKVFGVAEKPRLAIFRSLKNITIQIIDDNENKTLVAIDLKKIKMENTVDGALKLGEAVAKKCLENKIEKVVFDRSGYKYHGKIKAIADGVNKGGLKF